MVTTPEISAKPFEGECVKCGDFARVNYDVKGTALVEHNTVGGRLSAMATGIVQCESGHAYYVLKHDSEVLDPFAPDKPGGDK